MENGTIQKDAVSSGDMMCGVSTGEPVALSYFIDRLAEDLVLDEKIQMCRMCVIGGCEGQVSGMTCRNGVKTWLLNKVKAYAEDMPVRDEQYFAFLDRLRVSGCEFSQARERLEQAFPHLKRCADGADAILCAWQCRRASSGKRLREMREGLHDTCAGTDSAAS